jgi:hypothetical protein
MGERIYTILELKQLINESASEFKAKIGQNVESTNHKENEKAYKSANEKTKILKGGKSEENNKKLSEKNDGNKTMLDLELDSNCGDQMKNKIKAQAEGYTSELEKNNGIEKNGEFSDKIYKQLKKHGKEMSDNKVIAKKAGLTARTLPDSSFKKDSLYKESKKISVLNFKNTTFINESHMVSKIPDEYKVEGNRFKVKDCGNNEFIVEWSDNEAKILSYENKQKLNESIKNFHKLINYSSKEQFNKSTPSKRINENKTFNTILNTSRRLNEK